MLAEVPSAVKAVLSLCVLSGCYHLLTKEHTDNCSPYSQYWRSMTDREMKMMCIAKVTADKEKEKKFIRRMEFASDTVLSPSPMPAVRCNQSIPFSTSSAAPAAPQPPELEVQHTGTLELHWFFPGAGCCGGVQMGGVQHPQSQKGDILPNGYSSH